MLQSFYYIKKVKHLLDKQKGLQILPLFKLSSLFIPI